MLASHEVAWNETCRMAGFVPQQPLGDDLSWGLVATADTTSWVHVDDDGLGTAVVVKTGAKWWAVLKPCKGASPDDALGNLGSTKAYSADWSVQPTSGKNVFDAEAVLQCLHLIYSC